MEKIRIMKQVQRHRNEGSMRLEDMGNEFPEMPEEMREMIGQEVAKQIRKGTQRSSRMSKRSLAVLVLAATLALGMTAFAGVKIYQMQQKPVGNYGVSVTVDKNGEQGQSAGSENPTVLPVELAVGYLPEGMVETEEQKYSFADNPGRGGVSICFYGMDTGDDAFEILDRGVADSEQIQVAGYDGVYLEYENTGDTAAEFRKKIYVSYPDVHYVMEMYVGSDVSKEESLKIAEHIKLTPAAENSDTAVKAFLWSDYLAAAHEEAEKEAAASGEADVQVKLTASASEMANMHGVGEEFEMETFFGNDLGTISVTVKDIAVYDNVSMLDTAYCNEDFLTQETYENGKLKDTTIEFVNFGDGVERLDEVVGEKTTGQRFVYLTLAYTNHGSEDIKDVLFCPSVSPIVSEGDSYRIYQGSLPGADDASWDYARDKSLLMKGGEMSYYDVRGGERGNNYIPEIKAGETAEVHVGYFVNEDELPYLYLDPKGIGSEFTEENLAAGFVDIRQ